MESSSSLMNYGPKSIEEEVYMSGPKTHNKLEELISTLPRGNGLMFGLYVYQYEGFWHNSLILPRRTLVSSRTFQAKTQ